MEGQQRTRTLLLVGTLAACLPAAVLWLQANRPLDNFSLNAQSEEEIADIVIEQGKPLIDRKLQQDVNRETSFGDITRRWQTYKTRWSKRCLTT
jgi:hypothetical protein